MREPIMRIESLLAALLCGLIVACASLAEVLLKRSLKQATVVGAPGLAAVLDLLRTRKADAAAANKPILHELSMQLPGSRILEGRFSAERAAFALPKGREAALAYVNTFIEDAKSEGLVKKALDRAGARGALVAPPHTADISR